MIKLKSESAGRNDSQTPSKLLWHDIILFPYLLIPVRYAKGLKDQVAELKKQLRMVWIQAAETTVLNAHYLQYSEQPSNQATPVTNLDDTLTPGSSPANHTVSTITPLV